MYSYWIKKKEKNMIYFESREQKYATIRKRTHQESFFLPTFLKKKKTCTHKHIHVVQQFSYNFKKFLRINSYIKNMHIQHERKL